MLNIEEILLKLNLRQRFISQCLKVQPNKKLLWHRKLLFGDQTEYYDRASIEKALHPHEVYK